MSEKEQITSFPKAMMDYADYLYPQIKPPPALDRVVGKITTNTWGSVVGVEGGSPVMDAMAKGPLNQQMQGARLRGLHLDALDRLFNPLPQTKLTRRERLMCRINYRLDSIRENIALKIAPWLEGGE